MFRYICPVILAGGKSLRFGSLKQFYYYNNCSFLDYRINFFFELGFIDIYVSGVFIGYIGVFDLLDNGPLGGIFTILFFNSIFSHILFVPVDMNYFDISLFFIMFFKCNVFFSYFYDVYLFPFLISTSISVILFLFFFSFKLNFYDMYLFFFSKFILVEYFLSYYFCKKYFLNFNTYYNFIAFN